MIYWVLAGATKPLEIPFKEVCRLRPLPPKRVREIFVDYESDCESELNTTMEDSTMSQSMLDESLGTRSECHWKHENSQLRAENSRLKAELEETKSKLAKYEDFFKVTQKPTRANGSGSAPVFSADLTAVAIEAMGETCEAKMVHLVLDAFARIMGLTPPEDETHRVPRRDWFIKTRSKIDALLVNQRNDFLAKGGPFYVSFDATNLHSNNVMSMLVFNGELEYLNFGYKQVEAKSGRDIAAVMNQMLSEHNGLLSGLECFITDRCPAQELANHLICEIINSNRSDDSKVK